jgi:dipeptidyl-peptidase-4
MAEKSMVKRSLLTACLGLSANMPGFLRVAWAAADEPCEVAIAATRGYSLGMPGHVAVTPDGKHVLYLRSGPRDTKLGLYEYDLDSRAEHALAQPSAGPEHLSTEEKALRERTRMTLTGITDYALSDDGQTALVSQADHLAVLSLADGKTRTLPGGGWIVPRLSRDGKYVEAVRDNDMHVIDVAAGTDTQITHGGTDVITHGLPEFAAAEELDRAEGAWWSPDASTLVYEQADSTGVEKHFIADPEHPSVPPVEFRYPRAGTANAVVKLGLIARGGGETKWIAWDNAAFPYVASVNWPEHGRLTITVLNRPQTALRLLAVDPATGATSTLFQETDAAWLNLTPSHGLPAGGAKPLPYWLDDGSGFLWAAERGGQWALELRRANGWLDHRITPPDMAYVALNDVDSASGSVVFTAESQDRLSTGVYRVPLADGEPKPLSVSPGLHDAVFNDHQHGVFADRFSGADGSAGTEIKAADGHALAILPSAAETPPYIPKVEFLTTGLRMFDALVIRPRDFQAGRKYPVVLSVYAGPTVKVVHRTPRAYLDDQCMADQGFIVVSLDGRGTPGRGRDFERVTKNDLIDIPLQDQVDGLQALGQQFPEMDMHHVGVTGWSFGGYFTAMATIRRPDVFQAGVAGAPVVDFADYDTAYTERYLGTPEANPEAYRVSNVLTYADKLERPLLIMHGLTDDNVYFENTVKLTQALIAAGKPYNLLLLPGTHLLPDPVLRARVGEARVGFLRGNLK